MKNGLELLGLQIAACHYWESHPAVGMSAFCFAVPSAAFLAIFICLLHFVPRPYSAEVLIQVILYAILALMYTGAILTCALADYIYIRRGHRSYYGKVDIIFASIVFFTSVFDFWLRASFLETALLVAIAMASFMYSGISRSKDQWVFRHSLWHVVGGSIGTYGALRLPPASEHIGTAMYGYVGVAVAVYAILAAAFLFVSQFVLTAECRKGLWEQGAKYADWKLVPPLK
eukprot:TRINITY_DN49117_c0_g1_i1.p1 TRINITY_DN49117_c0_g1~~TRINITY_DN49117_c0_g1_i1.p1  ORF type:complete len:230 (+),score=14.48 TRINITY_DN49117_c0_g1_i1:59-748(+)